MSEKAPQIDARLPLALLCAIKQQDTPPQLMPDENPRAFFPNRLGLSGVIDVQIRQFKRLARLARRVDLAQVEALFELAVRRNDASEVLTDAGQRLAAFHFSGPVGTFRRLKRRLPRRLRRRAAVRALRSTHDAFLIASDLSVHGDPLTIQATDALTARVGEYTGACKLYGS
ncbi:MAG TPA: hypothetical protein VLC48_09950, partial [Gemmatimonadota bacterium]|nr:hypothetical protein [Gemmatimonadota bacterium]